jgi:hypothetical protein
MVANVEIVKLVFATRDVIASPDAAVARVELHVTLSTVPKLSSGKTNIWLLASTADVFTVTVVAPAAMTTLPDAAEPQTAGDAEEAQFVVVLKVFAVKFPPESMVTFVAPQS